MRVLGFVVLLFGLGLALSLSAASPEDRLTRHTRDGLDKRRPCWSPDGKRLAFARQEADSTHLWQYVWEPGKSDPPRRLLSDYDEPHFDATFAPRRVPAAPEHDPVHRHPGEHRHLARSTLMAPAGR